MPKPGYRSRTYRRIFVRTPGSRNVVHYKRRKPSKAKCGSCGSQLKGVPRELPYKIRGMPKSSKRPERPYGGVLCSACMREKLIEAVRK